MQLLHQDKQTPRRPCDSSSQTGLGRKSCILSLHSAGSCIPRLLPQSSRPRDGRSAPGAGKGGRSLPPTLTNDLIPPFGMLAHRLRMILTAIHETTLTLNLVRAQTRMTRKGRSFRLVSKTLFQHCLMALEKRTEPCELRHLLNPFIIFEYQGASRQGVTGYEGCNCSSMTDKLLQTSAIKPGSIPGSKIWSTQR